MGHSVVAAVVMIIIITPLFRVSSIFSFFFSVIVVFVRSLSKSKGQGHQAALPTAVGGGGRRSVLAVGKLLLVRCRPLGLARRFGAHGGGEGRRHIVAAARLQLVLLCMSSLR